MRELQALGCAAQALPLIDIGPAPDPQAVRQAWQDLPAHNVVMFVSANAVHGFFAARPAGLAWPQPLLAASTGPGTSAALLACGLADTQIVQPAASSPQFDSETLWPQLQARCGPWQWRSALVVRGGQGRDWLADTLRSHGAQVHFVAAYQRHAPQLDAAGRELLAATQRQPGHYLWLFSSSEAVAHLQQLATQAQWQHSRAWVTHPRIGQAAREAGFGSVGSVRPGVAAAAQQLRADVGTAGSQELAREPAHESAPQQPPLQSAAL